MTSSLLEFWNFFSINFCNITKYDCAKFYVKSIFLAAFMQGEGHYVPAPPPPSNRGMIRQKYPGTDGYSFIYLVIPLKPSLIEISHESHFVISLLNHCSIVGTYLSLRIIYVFKSLDFLSFSHHCNFHEMIKPYLASFVHFWFSYYTHITK